MLEIERVHSAEPGATAVAIVGGGITGLTAAYQLQSVADVHLFEQSDRWGGKIRTIRQDGFVVEAGADSWVGTKPWGALLCQQLGLAEEVIGTRAGLRRVYALRNGKLVALPEGMSLLAPARWMPFLTSPFFSPKARLRISAEMFVRPRREPGDESLASFVRRRFGNEALATLAEPLLGGIFMGDPETLSLQSTFPQLAATEAGQGSLIRAARAQRRATAPGGGSSVFLTLRQGMQQLVETCLKQTKAALHLNAPIDSIESVGDGFEIAFQGRTVRVHSVVLAVPARQAALLLQRAAPLAAATLSALETVSSATVSLAFRRSDVSHPLDGNGVIIAALEGRKVTSISWTSSKFEGRAPDGFVLLRTFAGGYRDPQIDRRSDVQLLSESIGEVRALLGITADPVGYWIFRWPAANPVYRVGHNEQIDQIERNLAPGIFLAGSPYRGVGVADCIHQGMVVASRGSRVAG